jgi:signal transduction histidine kinase
MASGAVAAGPDSPEVERALQSVVLQTVKSLTAWLAPLFFLFAPFDYLYSPPAASHALALLDLAVGVVMAATHLVLRSGKIPLSRAHAAAGMTVLLFLPYLLANIWITGQPVQSAGLALWQIGLSLVLLSWPWTVALLGLSNLAWAAEVTRLPPSPDWGQYGYILASATVISVVAHGVRLRTFRRLEGLRLAEHAQRMELERAQAAAREVETVRRVNRIKTEFINMAAHELATPMTPILLQLKVLRMADRSNLTEQQARSLDVLDRSLGRLNGLLEDILDSSRLQADRLPMMDVPVDVVRVVREAVEGYREPAAAAHVALDASAQGQPLAVRGDAKRLHQVVTNLLSNAIKFTPRGGHVRVDVSNDGAAVRVEVADTGMGLSPEDAPRLFQPFTQVHDPSRIEARGTGLGLYICKGIIERLGGRIGCRSPGPGKGSTFWFTLPLQASAAPAA